jgi:hypothetical protein
MRVFWTMVIVTVILWMLLHGPDGSRWLSTVYHYLSEDLISRRRLHQDHGRSGPTRPWRSSDR